MKGHGTEMGHYESKSIADTDVRIVCCSNLQTNFVVKTSSYNRIKLQSTAIIISTADVSDIQCFN